MLAAPRILNVEDQWLDDRSKINTISASRDDIGLLHLHDYWKAMLSQYPRREFG